MRWALPVGNGALLRHLTCRWQVPSALVRCAWGQPSPASSSGTQKRRGSRSAPPCIACLDDALSLCLPDYGSIRNPPHDWDIYGPCHGWHGQPGHCPVTFSHLLHRQALSVAPPGAARTSGSRLPCMQGMDWRRHAPAPAYRGTWGMGALFCRIGSLSSYHGSSSF